MNKINKDWEERFDKEFAVVDTVGNTLICDFDRQNTIDLYKPIKQFIQDLLTQQQEEIIERLEKLNKTFQTGCRKYQQYGGLGHDIRTCDCGLYNQAIDDAIRIIKEK